jgi:hypothetical protein
MGYTHFKGLEQDEYRTVRVPMDQGDRVFTLHSSIKYCRLSDVHRVRQTVTSALKTWRNYVTCITVAQ